MYGFADASGSGFGITFYQTLIFALELGLGKMM